MNLAPVIQSYLNWVRSHATRFARPGFVPPNHLSHGTVWIMAADRDIHISLNANGECNFQPVSLEVTGRFRVEIRDKANEILFTDEDVAS